MAGKPETHQHEKRTTNMLVNIDGDELSRIVYNDLLLTRECFLEDMDREDSRVFSLNSMYDKILIQKHIDALDLIIEYYLPPN